MRRALQIEAQPFAFNGAPTNLGKHSPKNDDKPHQPITPETGQDGGDTQY